MVGHDNQRRRCWPVSVLTSDLVEAVRPWVRGGQTKARRLRGALAAAWHEAWDAVVDAPPVTNVDWRYNRSRQVTGARVGIAVGVLIIAAFAVQGPAQATPASVWWWVAPPLAYMATAGFLVDHNAARLGNAGALACHAGGVLVTFPLLWRVAYAAPAFAGRGSGSAGIDGAVVWPLLFIVQVVGAFAVAWIVPGSFPRQFVVFRREHRAFRNSWRASAPVTVSPAPRRATPGSVRLVGAGSRR
jgi:hypothetical protein